MHGYEFFVDPSRCIGCESCVNACAECGTHRGQSMIHLDFIDRRQTAATVPFVCMHCGAAMIVLLTLARGQPIRAPPPQVQAP